MYIYIISIKQEYLKPYNYVQIIFMKNAFEPRPLSLDLFSLA